METGGYVRCFGIVAGERRHAFGFESHPPHRISPGRIVLTWGYVCPGMVVCGEGRVWHQAGGPGRCPGPFLIVWVAAFAFGWNGQISGSYRSEGK